MNSKKIVDLVNKYRLGADFQSEITITKEICKPLYFNNWVSQSIDYKTIEKILNKQIFLENNEKIKGNPTYRSYIIENYYNQNEQELIKNLIEADYYHIKNQEINDIHIETNLFSDKGILYPDFKTIIISIFNNILFILIIDKLFNPTEKLEIIKPQLGPSKSMHFPLKYSSLWHTNIQIPKIAIQRLVKSIDTNLDMKISYQDLIDFSHKHHVYLNDDVYEEIFRDCIKNRPILMPDRCDLSNIHKIKPLSVEEIHNSIQIHLKKNSNEQQEVYKKYFDTWMLLLDLNGEKNLIRQRLPDFQINSVQSAKDINIEKNRFRPSVSSEGKKQFINKIKDSIYLIPKRFEANLDFISTENIEKVEYDKENNYNYKLDPFTKTVNSQISETITFNSQKYYNEALRISLNPNLHINQKNPILTYVPENFDFNPSRTLTSLPNQPRKDTYMYESTPIIPEIKDDYSTKKNNKLKQKIKPTTSGGERIFYSSFKPENVHSLKLKLASIEPITDTYASPSTHKFREEIIDYKKPLYKTRIKCFPLENPYNMSQHDLRPKEALDLEEKEKKKKEQENSDNLNSFLGKLKYQNPWMRFFRRADLHRKEGFIDHKKPVFIENGKYQEPTEILNTLLRGETQYKTNFKRFHRSLRKDDKNLFFGENKTAKY